MLQKTSDRVRECYRLAAETRVQAMRASDSALKVQLLEVEDRYIRLAHSHELTESLDAFLGQRPPRV
jgi:hypothetical protein